MVSVKPLLLTVDRPSMFGQQDIARIGGNAYITIPRASGKLRAYPYRPAVIGNPFARESLASERLEELRERARNRAEWA